MPGITNSLRASAVLLAGAALAVVPQARAVAAPAPAADTATSPAAPSAPAPAGTAATPAAPSAPAPVGTAAAPATPSAPAPAGTTAAPAAPSASAPADTAASPAAPPASASAGAATPPAAPSAPAPAHGPARPLIVVSRGGAVEAAQRLAYFAPFTQQTGLKLQVQNWGGGIGAVRASVDSGAPDRDVVQVQGETLLLGCGEGLFETLDWSRIGGKDHYLPAGVSTCGVGTALYDYVLSWDRDKLQGTPSWADFWDVAKYPGKRGLPRGPRLNLEIALMADGVAPGDVYKTLRTQDGVERAFRKLDQLKPYIVWWTSDAQALQVLASGQVLMTVAPNGDIIAANGGKPPRRFGMQWDGGLIVTNYWAIMKNSPDQSEAYQFLKLAGDPARQAEVTAQTGYAGLAKGSRATLPKEVQDVSSGSKAHLDAGLQVDAQFWRDNLDKLTQRFNAWLAH